MTTDTDRPSLADRIALVAFMILGAAAAVAAAVQGVTRVAAVLGGGPVTVPVQFLGTWAVVDLGGAPVPVVLDAGAVTVDALPAGARGLAVAEAVLALAVVVVAVGCLLLLARATLRGRVFSRGSTALVATAGIAGLVGVLVVPALGNMVADLTVAELAGGGAVGVALLSFRPLPIVLAAFAIGIVATAFAVGARMQRDQEGLV